MFMDALMWMVLTKARARVQAVGWRVAKSASPSVARDGEPWWERCSRV